MSVTNIRPNMGKIDQTAGVVPKTSTTYSQAGVQYSSPTQVYGGISGAKFGIKPTNASITNTRPNN